MRRGGPGVTLAETVIALFLLVIAMLVITNLFHAGLRYSTRVEASHLATLVAQTKLEEIRAWSEVKTSTGYNYDDWSTYDGVTVPDPDHPDYEVTVEVQDLTLFSASASSEAAFPGEEKTLADSAKQVRVTVVWEGGRSQLSLTTVVADPTRDLRALNPIVVSPTAPIPSPLARDDQVVFEVYGYDSDDQVLSDLCFAWRVKPGSGNGTLAPSRDGRTCTFTNRLDLPSQPNVYTGGEAVVVAEAVYAGRKREGESAPITLQP